MKSAMLKHFDSDVVDNDFHTVLWTFYPLNKIPSLLKPTMTLYDLRTILVQSGVFFNRNTPADDYITSGHFALVRSVLVYKEGKTKTANAIYVSHEGLQMIKKLVADRSLSQCGKPKT